MSYELTTEKHDDYLHATASGTRSFQAVLAIARDVLSACAGAGVVRAVLDVRPLAGRLDTLESFTIPNRHFPLIRDRSKLSRCAIIDRKEAEDRFKFFENVAVNRGFLLRFFTDPESAVEWLKS